MGNIILVVGTRGNLGERIIRALLKKGAEVRAVVRPSGEPEKIKQLKKLGVQVYKLWDWNLEELTIACSGVSCVVSSLAGLREVIPGCHLV